MPSATTGFVLFTIQWGCGARRIARRGGADRTGSLGQGAVEWGVVVERDCRVWREWNVDCGVSREWNEERYNMDVISDARYIGGYVGGAITNCD